MKNLSHGGELSSTPRPLPTLESISDKIDALIDVVVHINENLEQLTNVISEAQLQIGLLSSARAKEMANDAWRVQFATDLQPLDLPLPIHNRIVNAPLSSFTDDDGNLMTAGEWLPFVLADPAAAESADGIGRQVVAAIIKEFATNDRG